MSNEARHKWDARYQSSGYLYGLEPAKLLVENKGLLPPRGRALDIACGEGRNAVYLAEQGLDVVGLDISAVGLRKARELAEQRGVALDVQLWDLERSVLPAGSFDVIVCIHYHQRSLCPTIAEALTPGGLLVLELHTTANLAYHAKPSRPFLVEPNELIGWFPTLQLNSYREQVLDGQAVAQLIARKPTS